MKKFSALILSVLMILGLVATPALASTPQCKVTLYNYDGVEIVHIMLDQGDEFTVEELVNDYWGPWGTLGWPIEANYPNAFDYWETDLTQACDGGVRYDGDNPATDYVYTVPEKKSIAAWANYVSHTLTFEFDNGTPAVSFQIPHDSPEFWDNPDPLVAEINDVYRDDTIVRKGYERDWEDDESVPKHDGWIMTAPNGGELGLYEMENDITLTAAWTPKVFNATFYGPNAVVVKGPTETEFNTRVVMPTPEEYTPAPGHVVLWYIFEGEGAPTDENFNLEATDAAGLPLWRLASDWDFMVTEEKDLYYWAQEMELEYTVIFKINGDQIWAPYTYGYDEEIKNPFERGDVDPAPYIREGWHLTPWDHEVVPQGVTPYYGLVTGNNRTTGNELEIVFDTEFGKNIHTVSYFVNGNLKHTDNVAFSDAITPWNFTAPAEETFEGWFSDPTCTQPMVWPAAMPDHDINVFGKTETILYNLQFTINGEVIMKDGAPDLAYNFKRAKGEEMPDEPEIPAPWNDPHYIKTPHFWSYNQVFDDSFYDRENYCYRMPGYDVRLDITVVPKEYTLNFIIIDESNLVFDEAKVYKSVRIKYGEEIVVDPTWGTEIECPVGYHFEPWDLSSFAPAKMGEDGKYYFKPIDDEEVYGIPAYIRLSEFTITYHLSDGTVYEQIRKKPGEEIPPLPYPASEPEFNAAVEGFEWRIYESFPIDPAVRNAIQDTVMPRHDIDVYPVVGWQVWFKGSEGYFDQFDRWNLYYAEIVADGCAAQLPPEDLVEDMIELGHEVVGWIPAPTDADINCIHQRTVFTADEQFKTCTVTFLSWNNVILKQFDVRWGTSQSMGDIEKWSEIWAFVEDYPNTVSYKDYKFTGFAYDIFTDDLPVLVFDNEYFDGGMVIDDMTFVETWVKRPVENPFQPRLNRYRYPTDPVLFSATTVRGIVGEEFSFDFRVDGVYATDNLVASIYFDPNMFEFVGVEQGEVWTEVANGGGNVYARQVMPGKISFAFMSPTAPVSAEGVIMSVKLRVNENAPIYCGIPDPELSDLAFKLGLDVYPIHIVIEEFTKPNTAMPCDYYGHVPAYNIEEGFIIATELQYGDVDLDGEVTMLDVLLVIRDAMGLEKIDSVISVENEYPDWALFYSLRAADYDYDGEIEVEDALWIMRYAEALISREYMPFADYYCPLYYQIYYES